MEKLNRILQNATFKNIIENINEVEKTRVYCKHSFEHLIDTARICYIINLEENLGFDKEIIYTAAILHDIGRFEEYENGVPHNEASAKIANKIMAECGFSKDEIKIVTDAIYGHRIENDTISLGNILYRGDKLSRMCFLCNSEKSCYWDKNKKNMKLKY